MRREVGIWLLLVGLWVALIGERRPPAPDDLPGDVERLDLHVGPKEWVQLQDALTHARRIGRRDARASVWVKGTLVGDGARYPCRLRLRGDYPNHWQYDKFSLRVRLRGDELYRGARELNLIVSHDRSYFLEMAGEWWNRRLGLVPCPSRLVWVTLNGEDKGTFALVEELSQELLEREGYPYAPIFKPSGEHFGPPWGYQENRRLVYSRAYYGPKLARAPGGAAVSRVFEEVLRVYREHPRFEPAQLERLSHLLDLDAWARFSALCRLMGSHPEHPHNVTAYFNAATGLFEPVFLDPEGAEVRTAEAFEASSHMLVFTRELLTLRPFRDLRDRHLRAILEQVGAFTATYDGYGRYLGLLDRDPYLRMPYEHAHEADPRLEDLIEVGVTYKGFFEASQEVLAGFLAQTDRPLEPPPLTNQDSPMTHLVPRRLADGSTALTLRHGRPRTLHLRALTLEGLGATASRLAADVVVDDGYQRRTWRWAPPLALEPGQDLTLRLDGFDPATQRLSLEVDDAGVAGPTAVATASTEVGVQLEFLDDALPALVAAVSDLVFTRRGDDWVLPAGDYVVRAPLIVPKGGRLVLEAGARIRFAPGAALLSYKPLIVAGTAADPVICEPLDPQQGWGVLGVLSTRAWSPTPPAERRSRVEHLVVRGARGAVINGVTYTGGLAFLFSDVDVIRSCFVDVGGDDGLNVKRGDVRVSESLFVDCPQDAIDLDWCTGSVERSLMLACGGDGVDLSGAEGVEIRENVVLALGDKGVSVGERSRVGLEGNLLAGCAIGIASKDLSQTRSRDDVLVDCDEAFAAYRKKPIFGGGVLLAERPRLLGCAAVERHDPRSQIQVRDSTVADFRVPGLRSRLLAAPRATTEALLDQLDLGPLRADWPWSHLDARP